MPDGKKVKRIMNEKGITQKDLAEAIGMGRANLSHMLKVNVNSRESTVSKICDFLGCTYEDIRRDAE